MFYLTGFLIGFAAFFLAGLGLGGGVLFVPLLVSILSLNQKYAQYLGLVCYIPMGICVTAMHLKKREFSIKSVIKFLPAGILGAAFGALIAGGIDTAILRKVFGSFVCVYGTYMLVTGIKDEKNRLSKKRGENK